MTHHPLKKRLKEPLFLGDKFSSLGFCLLARCRRDSLFLGRAAVEAHEHRGPQNALERAVVARLVDAAFDTTHGVASAAKALKR